MIDPLDYSDTVEHILSNSYIEIRVLHNRCDYNRINRLYAESNNYVTYFTVGYAENAHNIEELIGMICLIIVELGCVQRKTPYK